MVLSKCVRAIVDAHYDVTIATTNSFAGWSENKFKSGFFYFFLKSNRLDTREKS